MNIVYSIYQFAFKKSYYQVFLMFLVTGYFISILSGTVIGMTQIKVGYQPESNTYVQLLSAIVFSPMVETIVFQHLIISALQIYKVRSFHAIAVSGIIFGLAHGLYGLVYLLSATAFGLLLSTCYIIFKKRKQKPFWTTFLLHGLVNLAGVFKYL